MEELLVNMCGMEDTSLTSHIPLLAKMTNSVSGSTLSAPTTRSEVLDCLVLAALPVPHTKM